MSDLTLKRIEEIAAYSGPDAVPGIRFRPAARALGVTAWGMNVLEVDPGCARYPEHDHPWASRTSCDSSAVASFAAEGLALGAEIVTLGSALTLLDSPPAGGGRRRDAGGGVVKAPRPTGPATSACRRAPAP
jgi:hypothetical protein